MVKKTRKNLKKKLTRYKKKILGVRYRYGGGELKREELKQIVDTINQNGLLNLDKRYNKPTKDDIWEPIKTFYENNIENMNKEKWIKYLETTTSENESKQQDNIVKYCNELYELYLYFISERRKRLDNQKISFLERVKPGTRKEKLLKSCSTIQPLIDGIKEYTHTQNLLFPIQQKINKIISKLDTLKDVTCNPDIKYEKPLLNILRGNVNILL